MTVNQRSTVKQFVGIAALFMCRLDVKCCLHVVGPASDVVPGLGGMVELIRVDGTQD